MLDSHWFDNLNKTLVSDTSRRTVLGAATVALASLACGGTSVAEAARNRKKKRKRRKNRPHVQPQSCSDGACADVPEWFGNQQEIGFCEDKCRRCRDRSKFCIVRYPEPTRATCCHEDQECCPVFLDGAYIGQVCVPNDRTCCPDDRNGVCLKTDPASTCCPGIGCVDTKTDANHCGICNRLCAVDEECVDSDCACTDGRARCGDSCVDTTSDPNHCGLCNRLCAVDQRCVDNDCIDKDYYGDCPPPLIPNPCPNLPVPGGCVADQNIVCCADFNCIVSGNPADYSCCGYAANPPEYACRQTGEICRADRYAPLATHCQRGNTVCGS